MKIRAIRNRIIFQFLDEVSLKGQFDEGKQQGIIVLGDHDKSAKTSRWAKIISLGPECSDELRADDCEILIENLRWTEGAMYEGEKYWMTDETQLLGYRYNDSYQIG